MTTTALIASIETTANDLLNNPLVDSFYKTCIRRKMAALKANPTAKNVYNTVDDLNLIAAKALRETQP